jgi:hypothetical protein
MKDTRSIILSILRIKQNTQDDKRKPYNRLRIQPPSTGMDVPVM